MRGFDRELQRWVVEHRIGVLDPVAQALTLAGEAAAVWLALALVVALRRRVAAPFLLVALTALVAELATWGLKAAFARPRPDAADALLAQPATSSFPSGHAVSSFACATVLASLAPRLRVPLLALAVLVAWSRVYVGAHYPADVVAGAALGIALGLAVPAAVRALRRPAAGRPRSPRARPPG